MRPKTSESGILSTKRNKPVSTSMLTRMLVPNPKKEFQSPDVQMAGWYLPVITMRSVIAHSCRSLDDLHQVQGGVPPAPFLIPVPQRGQLPRPPRSREGGHSCPRDRMPTLAPLIRS